MISCVIDCHVATLLAMIELSVIASTKCEAIHYPNFSAAASQAAVVSSISTANASMSR